MKNRKRTVTADKAMKRMMIKRIEKSDVTDAEKRLVGSMSKIEHVCEDISDKVYEMRRKCFTIKETAKALGVADRLVSAIIDYKMWRDVGFMQIRLLRDAGLSIKAIAKKLKISDRIVSRVLRGQKAH